MKKIIRIASVIALVGASLLYVGCTKDFSADIAKTNQDVAALNQKIETLNSTVQTINSTVDNLKTTKADLTAVNALGDRVTTLGGKIDELDGKLTSTKNDLEAAIAAAKQEAIDAASADAATKLAAAKEELEGVIDGVEEKVDSLKAFTEAAVDSLAKDIVKLQKNADTLGLRIAELEGKVVDLAARVSSIVAVPSMNAEFRRFDISDIDTTFFVATFAVTPKAAVKNIKPENLKVNFKEGLTRGDNAPLDSTVKAAKVVPDEAKGEITIFVKYSDTTTVKNATGGSSIYYSLSFAGEDKAGRYEENSEYVKAHDKVDVITTDNAKIVKGGVELTAEKAKLEDTLAFDGSQGTRFASLFGALDVAFKFNDELISKDVIGDLLDTTFKVVPGDSTISKIGGTTIQVNDSTAGIVVKTNGTYLCADKDDVGNYVTIGINGVKINDFLVAFTSITEKHWVGAKTVEYNLPAVSEPWTYTSWEEVSRTVSITDCEDIHKAVPGTGIIEGKFTIYPDPGKGVNIAIDGAERITNAAKDTTYKVAFKYNVGNLSPNDTVNFTINWQYTLEARPEDETIALADVDTVAASADYNKGVKVAIDKDINKLTFAAFDAAYDKTIDSAYVAGQIANNVKAIADATVYNDDDTLQWTVSNGCVEVPALTKAGAYDVELEAVVFGIKYTYTFTIDLTWKEALKLHATPYVSAGVAKVDADTTDSPYTLKTMDMAKYLQIFNADTLAKGFTGYKVEFKAELEDSINFANEKKDTTRGSITLSKNEVTVSSGVLESAILDWSNYKGREVKITAYLVTEVNSEKDTVDSYTFTLKYDKPVTSFAAGTQTIKRIAGQPANAVLAKSFTVKGLYHGDKNLIVNTTGAWINGKNYYGCKITYDIDKASFKVDGVETIFTKGVDYTLDNDTTPTAITFIGDNNNKNIEASIPVVLTYNYDYNEVQAYKDNVVIKVVNE